MSQAKVVTVTDIVPYINATGYKAAGDVVVVGSLVGVIATDLEPHERGSMVVQGQISMPKITGAINAGAKVYWDADANPVGGTAGSGAISVTSTDGPLCGVAVGGAGASDSAVVVYLVPLAS